MKYSLHKQTNNTKFIGLSTLAMAAVLLTSMATVSLSVQAKGGQNADSVPTNCNPIVNFSAVDGDYTGGYAIMAQFVEQQCVSGKTRVKIAGINAATGQTEFSTPVDFDKNQVYFYGVRRATTYEIKLTITRDKDNTVLGAQSVFVTTRTQ